MFISYPMLERQSLYETQDQRELLQRGLRHASAGCKCSIGKKDSWYTPA